MTIRLALVHVSYPYRISKNRIFVSRLLSFCWTDNLPATTECKIMCGAGELRFRQSSHLISCFGIGCAICRFFHDFFGLTRDYRRVITCLSCCLCLFRPLYQPLITFSFVSLRLYSRRDCHSKVWTPLNIKTADIICALIGLALLITAPRLNGSNNPLGAARRNLCALYAIQNCCQSARTQVVCVQDNTHHFRSFIMPFVTAKCILAHSNDNFNKCHFSSASWKQAEDVFWNHHCQ